MRPVRIKNPFMLKDARGRAPLGPLGAFFTLGSSGGKTGTQLVSKRTPRGNPSPAHQFSSTNQPPRDP